MTTGKKDADAFITVSHRKGSIAYRLYATLTTEGPSYDSLGVDSEGDEFEVTFDDGCVTIETKEISWLTLNTEHLLALASLSEAAETAFEAWRPPPSQANYSILSNLTRCQKNT